MGGDRLGELDGPRELRPARDDLLDEPDAERFFRAELVAGEQPSHRVAPAGRLHEAERGAGEREDAALDLDLRELRVRRGDADVLREAKLDAERQAATVHGDDGGLGPLAAVHAPGVDERRFGAGDERLARGDQRARPSRGRAPP